MKKETPICGSCLNENCFIKKHLHLEKMQQYIDRKNSFVCKKSQQFIIEGAPTQGLYFVYKGKVKTVKTGIYGREQIVRLTTNGDVVGFRGFATSKRCLIGAAEFGTTKPYSASIFNISAMSYGAISENAILALNQGAKLGGFYHNTGEGIHFC